LLHCGGSAVQPRSRMALRTYADGDAPVVCKRWVPRGADYWRALDRRVVCNGGLAVAIVGIAAGAAGQWVTIAIIQAWLNESLRGQ